MILKNTLIRAYNFMIKRILRGEAKTFLPGKVKDGMFLFLYHVFGLHFPESIKR